MVNVCLQEGIVIVISSRVPISGVTSDNVRCIMKSTTWAFLSSGAHCGQSWTRQSSPHTFKGVRKIPQDDSLLTGGTLVSTT